MEMGAQLYCLNVTPSGKIRLSDTMGGHMNNDIF